MGRKQGVDLPHATKRMLVRAAATVAKLYDEYCDLENMSGSFRNEVSPLRATTDGLCLAFSHHSPAELWTPWGLWLFGDDGRPDEQQVKRFMKFLRVRQLQPMGPGLYGPVYALLAVGRCRLPTPVVSDAGDRTHDARVARIEWKRLIKAARPYSV